MSRVKVKTRMVLRVKMIQAKDLVDLDGLGSGKSDPYVILTVGAHTFKLDTKLDTLNPVWEKNNVFDFPIEVCLLFCSSELEIYAD